MSRNVLEHFILQGVYVPEVEEKLANCRLGPYDCILYQGYISSGYGKVAIHGLRASVHRLAWTLKNGEIPDDLTIDHRPQCFRNCINVSHMEVVTLTENVRRSSTNYFPRVLVPGMRMAVDQ
jgi:hypothetical protein